MEGILLLLPYSWPHAFIPIVPYYLLPVLIDTPSPFVFGTSSRTYSYVKELIPEDVDTLFLHDECSIPTPHIPADARRWLYSLLLYFIIRINSLEQLDVTLPDSIFCTRCKAIISSFYWMLLPSFSHYLYTLLGNVCLFNTLGYLANEVSEEYHCFYERLLGTQVGIEITMNDRVLQCLLIIFGVPNIVNLFVIWYPWICLVVVD